MENTATNPLEKAMKHIKNEIVDIDKVLGILLYLYKQGILFNHRDGVKKIFNSLAQANLSKADIRQLKEFLDSLLLVPHKSGEYPIVKNLEEYKYLKYAIFDETFTRYEVNKDMTRTDFSTDFEYRMYQKAYAEAKEKYFFDFELDLSNF